MGREREREREGEGEGEGGRGRGREEHTHVLSHFVRQAAVYGISYMYIPSPNPKHTTQCIAYTNVHPPT